MYNGDKPNKKTRIKILISILLLTIIIILICCKCNNNTYLPPAPAPMSSENNNKIPIDSQATTSEINNDFNGSNGQKSITIHLQKYVQCKDNKCNFEIANSEKNIYDMQISYVEDGKTIYQTGIIKVGHRLDWATADISKGKHNCIAHIIAYTTDNNQNKVAEITTTAEINSL